jgi:hypothetical protein
MEVKLQSVTPDMAAALLANNGHNRKLNSNRVNGLVAAMRSGEWQLNGETVIVSDTGKLMDGQHRLKAVIAFGRPVDLLIAYGANEDAFHTIDTGKGRSPGDILSMSDIRNPTACAAVAKLVWQIIHRVPMMTTAPASYLLKVMERFPAIQKWAIETNGKGANTILPQASLITALVYLEDIAKKPASAIDFYEGVTVGANLSEGSSVLALRNRIINARSSGQRLGADWAWPITAKALSYFEAGQKVTKLRYVQSRGPAEVPDLFDVHLSHLSPSQRLGDLLPPERNRIK